MEASQNKTDVTIQFVVGGLVILFAGNFHLSSCVQKLVKNFMFVQWLKIFFIFWGAILIPKSFVANIETPKGTTMRKSAWIDAFWSK
jgi:hypothetical protein